MPRPDLAALERELLRFGMAARARPELRGWPHRSPHLALVVYPLSCAAVLPAVPVIAGAAHAGNLVRWAACIVLGGLVTAAILLFLELMILLG